MTDSSGVGIDVGFTQRVKALACTAPLHDLDARKGAIQAFDFAAYQMSELALHAIDLVTLAMDFAAGAGPDEVCEGLAIVARQQAPGRSAGEYDQVAQWVLENLINVGSADRGFRAVYGTVSPNGGYDRRSFDFKLLEESPGADGDIFLRATNEAVNVLVGALEVDIESAQIAADLRLETLIKRGRLSDAQTAAQTARYRTIQYGEMLRLRLEAVTRDVRSVDWIIEMPAFLEEALEHIKSRYHAENAILVNLTEARDTADTAVRKRQAATLVEVVRDCLRRHEQLQAALQQAGRRFRGEQDRQTFAASPTRSSLDLHGQLLVPALDLAIADANRPALRFLITAAGPMRRSALRLIDFFDGLITPSVERDLLGGVVIEPDLDSGQEPPMFSEDCYAALESLLELDPAMPRRLSGLLDEAREIDPDLPLLAVVRVLSLASEEIESARRHGNPSVFLAVDDGTQLDDAEFAGADLLLSRAEFATLANEEAYSA